MGIYFTCQLMQQYGTEGVRDLFFNVAPLGYGYQRPAWFTVHIDSGAPLKDFQVTKVQIHVLMLPQQQLLCLQVPPSLHLTLLWLASLCKSSCELDCPQLEQHHLSETTEPKIMLRIYGDRWGQNVLSVWKTRMLVKSKTLKLVVKSKNK